MSNEKTCRWRELVSTRAMIAMLVAQAARRRRGAHGFVSSADARRAHSRQSSGMSVMGT